MVFLLWMTTILKVGAQEQQSLLNKFVTVKAASGSIKDYLSLMSDAGIPLSYSSNYIDLEQNKTITPGQYRVGALLELLFPDKQVNVELYQDKIILLAPDKPALYILSGFVRTNNSREILPYASVYVKELNVGAIANDYGHYTIKLPKGTYQLYVSYVGHEPENIVIRISENTIHNFNLATDAPLPVLTVNAAKQNIYALNNSTAVNPANIQRYPFGLGQADPLKVLQLKAGVAGGLSGSSLNVRGGGSDQNLVTLDRVPVYNYNHFGGILSIFNSDIVKRIDFFKGYFPSRYEGRLSSVIDVKTKDGDMNEHHGKLDIGLLTASAAFEGPVVKNKASYILSARRSWLDGVLRLLDPENLKTSYYLYDANIKLNYVLNPAHRIYFSGYTGSDNFNLNLFADPDWVLALNWSNKLLSLRWNQVHNPKMFRNTTVTFSQFNNSLNIGAEPKDLLYNRIREIGVNNDCSYHWQNDFVSTFGLGVNFTNFNAPFEDSNHNILNQRQRSAQLKYYMDNTIDLSSKWQLRAGLHYTCFFVQGKNYHSFQPRTLILYRFNEHNELTASYSIMTQFYHQISLNGISLPNEFRSPSTANLAPEHSSLYELSYSVQPFKRSRATLSLYYKNLRNILMYHSFKNGIDSAFDLWSGPLISGKGDNKGLEIEYGQQVGLCSFDIAYTLSKSRSSFEEINNGRYFNATNDMLHLLNAAITVTLSKRWIGTAIYAYSTGKRLTVLQNGQQAGAAVNEPNNYQLSDNYTISLGAVHNKKYKKNRSGALRFGINNLIGNPAPLIAVVEYDNREHSIHVLRPFRLLPYIGYSYSF